jgi:hypothetical protein
MTFQVGNGTTGTAAATDANFSNNVSFTGKIVYRVDG